MIAVCIDHDPKSRMEGHMKLKLGIITSRDISYYYWVSCSNTVGILHRWPSSVFLTSMKSAYILR